MYSLNLRYNLILLSFEPIREFMYILLYCKFLMVSVVSELVKI